MARRDQSCARISKRRRKPSLADQQFFDVQDFLSNDVNEAIGRTVATSTRPIHTHNFKHQYNSTILSSFVRCQNNTLQNHEDLPIGCSRSCWRCCHEHCFRTSFEAIEGFRRELPEQLRCLPTTGFVFEVHRDGRSRRSRNL